MSITVAKHNTVISIIGREFAKECHDTKTGPSILPSFTNTCNQTAAIMKGTIDCDATAAIVLTAKWPNSKRRNLLQWTSTSSSLSKTEVGQSPSKWGQLVLSKLEFDPVVIPAMNARNWVILQPNQFTAEWANYNDWWGQVVTALIVKRYAWKCYYTKIVANNLTSYFATRLWGCMHVNNHFNLAANARRHCSEWSSGIES